MFQKIIIIYAIIITLIFAVYIIYTSIESGRNSEAMRELENINQELRESNNKFEQENLSFRNTIGELNRNISGLKTTIGELREIENSLSANTREAYEAIGRIETEANKIRD